VPSNFFNDICAEATSDKRPAKAINIFLILFLV